MTGSPCLTKPNIKDLSVKLSLPDSPASAQAFSKCLRHPRGLQQDLRICELGFQPPLLQTAGLETQQLVTV